MCAHAPALKSTFVYRKYCSNFANWIEMLIIKV